MPNEWRRSFGWPEERADSGHIDLITLRPNETLAATWWSVWLSGFYQGETFPVGFSVGKWGLVLYNPLGDPPDPLTDPSADWIDIVPVVWKTSVDYGSQTVWSVNADTGIPQRKAQAQRRNTYGATVTLAMCWHYWGEQSATNWLDGIQWACTADAYILNVQEEA